MRIDTTTQPSRQHPAHEVTSSALFGGEPAADGDFLALLATLVGSAGEDGEAGQAGVLLPGSPLLGTTPEETGELLEAAIEQPGDVLDEQGDEPLDTVAPGPWYVSAALAAMLARPAVLSDTSPLTLAREEVAELTTTIDETVTATSAADETTLLDSLPEGEAAADEAVLDEAPAPATTELPPDDGTAVADDTEDGEVPSTASRTGAIGEVRTGSATTTDAAADADETTEPVRDPATRRTAAPARVEAPAEPRAASRAEVALDGDALRPDETAGPSTASRERVTSPAASSAISRVLDALDQLERMPPPRQVVLELGDLRVRMGLEDGAVRLQIVGEDRGQGRDLLRAAEDALRERGFDLAGDRRDGQQDRPGDQQRPDLASPRPGPGTARIARPNDLPTGTATRAAIHL